MDKTIIFTIINYTIQDKPLYDVYTKHKDFIRKNTVGVKASELYGVMQEISADLNNNANVAVLFEIG